MRITLSVSRAAPVAAIGITALVSACASSGNAGGSAVAAGARTGAQASVPATGTSPVVARSSPSAVAGQQANAAAAPSCQASDLKVAKGSVGAAAGSVYLQIDFTNASGAACTLYGYPGVALTTARTSASQVGGAAARTTGMPAKRVTLAPDASASATLRIVDVANYPAASCGPVSGSYIQVYAPGQKSAAYLSYPAQTCTKPVFALGIAAIQPGVRP
jgi:hypothetical protein